MIITMKIMEKFLIRATTKNKNIDNYTNNMRLKIKINVTKFTSMKAKRFKIYKIIIKAKKKIIKIIIL